MEDLFYQIYNNIFDEFRKIIEIKSTNNKRLYLRLLPLSTGIFINNNPIKRKAIFKVLKSILKHMDLEFAIKMYIMDIIHFNEYINL